MSLYLLDDIIILHAKEAHKWLGIPLLGFFLYVGALYVGPSIAHITLYPSVTNLIFRRPTTQAGISHIVWETKNFSCIKHSHFIRFYSASWIFTVFVHNSKCKGNIDATVMAISLYTCPRPSLHCEIHPSIIFGAFTNCIKNNLHLL